MANPSLSARLLRTNDADNHGEDAFHCAELLRRKHPHIKHERRSVTSTAAVGFQHGTRLIKQPEAFAGVARRGNRTCHYTPLGNVRSVGLRGAAWMIDSDRTTHLLPYPTCRTKLR
jgi:hypothetical protein